MPAIRAKERADFASVLTALHFLGERGTTLTPELIAALSLMWLKGALFNAVDRTNPESKLVCKLCNIKNELGGVRDGEVAVDIVDGMSSKTDISAHDVSITAPTPTNAAQKSALGQSHPLEVTPKASTLVLETAQAAASRESFTIVGGEARLFLFFVRLRSEKGRKEGALSCISHLFSATDDGENNDDDPRRRGGL